MSSYLALLLILYGGTLLGITYCSRMDTDYHGFVIGSRKVGVWGVVTSLAANLRDGSGLVIWISLAAIFGFGAFWIAFGVFAAFLLMAWQAPRIRQEAEDHHYITLSDMLRHRAGPWLGRAGTLVVTTTALLYASGNMFAAGTLTSVILGVHPVFGICAVGTFVALYLIVGGYMTVIRTDVLQGFLLVAITLAFFFVADWPSASQVFHEVAAFPADMTVGFFLLLVLFAYSAADHWQRLFSAADQRVARTGFLYVIPYYALVVFSLILFGMNMHDRFPETPPDNLFFSLFSEPSFSPLLLAVLGLYTLVATMSTLDTQTFVFSSTLMKAFNYDQKTDRTRFVRLSRFIMGGLLLFMAVIATFIGDIISFLVDAVTILAVLGPVILYVTMSKPSDDKIRDYGLAGAVLIGYFLHGILFFAGVFNSGILFNLIPASVTALFVGLVAVFRSR